MTQARYQLPPELGGLVKRDLERVIEQANLGSENEQIARLYYLGKVPQIDIATELDITRKTVGRRIPMIRTRMQDASKKLYS